MYKFIHLLWNRLE